MIKAPYHTPAINLMKSKSVNFIHRFVAWQRTLRQILATLL